MHITSFCPSSFSFANKLLTSHVWLSCEGKKIKYIPNISEKERLSWGGMKKCTEHVFTCSAGKAVRHSEKPVQRHPALVREQNPQHPHRGSFGSALLTPVSPGLSWGRQQGKKGCCSQPLTWQLFCLSHKRRVKIPAQGWKARPFFHSSTVSDLCLFILFPYIY